MRTFSIYTLGCKVNQYESAQIAQLLEGLGLSEAVSGQKPDLAVINTCCVTEAASAKSRYYIQRALKTNPAGVKVVCGCLPAMNSRENPPCDSDNVHIISSRDELAQRIAQIIIGHNPFIKAKNGLKIKDGIAKFAKYPKLTQLSKFKGHTRAFLKVQDGCDGLCTYCIVPKVRPVVRSKPMDEAIEEAKALVAAGHKEIVVTGVNLGAYGQKSVRKTGGRCQKAGDPASPSAMPWQAENGRKVDERWREMDDRWRQTDDRWREVDDRCGKNDDGWREMDDPASPSAMPWQAEDGRKVGDPASPDGLCRGKRENRRSENLKLRIENEECGNNYKLTDLLMALAQIPGLMRIRVSSLEPGDISEELLDVFCAHRNIMPHIHLSVQSGSSATLKRMCRRYDADELRAKIELIKRRLDRPAITCDIIVGFPGETDEDFQETVQLSKWAGFSKIHVFPFSVRTGTPAAKLKGRLPENVIKKRTDILRKVNDELGRKFVEQFVGQTCKVLIEGSKDKEAFGHSERYFVVSLATKTPGHKEKQNNLVPLGLSGKYKKE